MQYCGCLSVVTADMQVTSVRATFSSVAHLDDTTSDLARTYPVSGKFTVPQAKLYSAVLSVQKALIDLCTPTSGHSLASIHKKSVDLLGQELVKVQWLFYSVAEGFGV